MVHGDSEQTLRVLVAYYRQKTEAVMYTASVEKNKRDTSIASLSLSREKDLITSGNNEIAHTLKIKMELSHERTYKFCNYVDGIYKESINNHFRNWHDPSSPVIENNTVL